MPNSHSLLSPSSCDRWTHCPPSVRLSEECGVKDTGSSYAAEGTDAHTLCEYLLRKAIGLPAEDPTGDLSYYNAQMQECAEGYVQAILELAANLTDPVIFPEQRVDFSEYVPGGFGTSDAIIIGDGMMYVVDFKYGTGVPVTADHNPQLSCYALGACLMFGDLYDVDSVTLVVCQPRLNNFSRWEMTVPELMTWAEEVLKPAADLALAGAGEFACGDWCRFCRAKSVCRKRAEHNLELAQYDFQRPPYLEDDEVEAILGKIDDLTSWAADIKDYALQQALRGKLWDNWKLVEGRSVRKYQDDAAVAAVVEAAGYEPYEKKLLGITAMTQALGKKKFEELLGGLVIKPQGKPVLVPRTGKRLEINSAYEDFKEEN